MRCSLIVKMISTALLVPYIFSLCYGFVLLGGSATAHDGLYLPADTAWLYQLTSVTLMNEKSGAANKSVGFYIQADVLIESVWHDDRQKLLQLELIKPELHIKSRKHPDSDGFARHSSMLDHFDNHKFYILWRNGLVDKILLNKNEPVSLANLKKGISSLLQFQSVETTSESDASGKCDVKYEIPEPKSIVKTKTNCRSDDLQYLSQPRRLLQTVLESDSKTWYKLGDTHLVTVESKERHIAFLAAKKDIGSEILVEQKLQFKETRQGSAKKYSAGSFAEVLQLVNNEAEVTEETLTTELEHEFDDSKTFFEIVAENKKALNGYGSVQAASVFLKLLNVARRATVEDFTKTLKSKSNKQIIEAIFDVLGYTQTSASHGAAMKHLHFDDPKLADQSERYLWALSVSSQPNPELVVDLLNQYRKTLNIPPKVKETLILTIGAMARNLDLLSHGKFDKKIHKEVEKTILNHLETSKKLDERLTLLRALVNLQSPSTLSTLIRMVSTGQPKETVIAWKAIYNLKMLTPELEPLARRVFLNLNKDYDTSARTIALDVLLENKPSDNILSDIILFLGRRCNQKEVQQYTMQRLQMLIEKDDTVSQKIVQLIKTNSQINNYHVLSRRGLSVAMERHLYSSDWSNGTLSSVQEMKSGQVKRGVVSINLEQSEENEEIFALGIFSSGLGSFMQNSEETDENMVGGMELSVLGTQMRQFVFFNGQGELMGHVWSGTGSEKTTAFQAFVMLHDYLNYVRLSNGFIACLDVKSAASFDLSGQIEISIWYRNANSQIEKSAGILISGGFKVDSTFVRSQVDFNVALEPKLELNTYVDFSSANVNMCMRLQQPESLIKHNVYKVERIPGSKHKIREHIHRRHLLTGKTFALNKKNSEMCNAIYR